MLEGPAVAVLVVASGLGPGGRVVDPDGAVHDGEGRTRARPGWWRTSGPQLPAPRRRVSRHTPRALCPEALTSFSSRSSGLNAMRTRWSGRIFVPPPKSGVGGVAHLEHLEQAGNREGEEPTGRAERSTSDALLAHDAHDDGAVRQIEDFERAGSARDEQSASSTLIERPQTTGRSRGAYLPGAGETGIRRSTTIDSLTVSKTTHRPSSPAVTRCLPC